VPEAIIIYCIRIWEEPEAIIVYRISGRSQVKVTGPWPCGSNQGASGSGPPRFFYAEEWVLAPVLLFGFFLVLSCLQRQFKTLPKGGSCQEDSSELINN
jgi:hypothetical protein